MKQSHEISSRYEDKRLLFHHERVQNMKNTMKNGFFFSKQSISSTFLVDERSPVQKSRRRAEIYALNAILKKVQQEKITKFIHSQSRQQQQQQQNEKETIITCEQLQEPTIGV